MKLQLYGKGWEQDGRVQTLSPEGQRESGTTEHAAPPSPDSLQQPSHGWETHRTDWAGLKQ